jgi:hypothetical protein
MLTKSEILDMSTVIGQRGEEINHTAARDGSSMRNQKMFIKASVLVAAAVFGLLPCLGTAEAAQSTNAPLTITITVTPALSSVGLSNNTVNTIGPSNHGAVVGTVVVTTNPSGGSTSNVTLALSGTDAAKFALSSAQLPSNLLVGPNDLPAGTYNLTLTGTTP